MAKAKNVNPPFAWLGRFWTPVGLALVTLTAAFFRFFQIGTLPPGLDETSARIGYQALTLGKQHWLPSLDPANSYSALWVWLQTISVHIFGHSAWALRIWPALLGTAAVFVTWLWLDDWFGRRTAWAGALMLAVSPWAVTISRAGLPSAQYALLIPLTLWLGGRALREPSRGRYAALGGALAANLLSGPIGWLFTAAVVAVAAWRLGKTHNLMNLTKGRAVGIAVAGIGAAALGYFIGTSLPAIAAMPKALAIATSPAVLGHNFVRVLLMFNVHGDENYRHNLAGYPMLNAFVGLMMVAGLLVCISRLHQLRYRVLLVLTIVMLIPAILTTTNVPNAAWASGLIAPVFALAAIGTAYMLELWYATFPINSAARATGQAAIILLLTLTLFQGYTQYFRAWALSTAVYSAHNEGTAQIASHIKTDKFNGSRFVVTSPELFPVVQYLDYPNAGYQLLSPAGLTALPVAAGLRQFYIAAPVRDEAVKTLKSKFPGGVLRPHYSNFNQVEIYYTYEVSK